MLIRNARVSTEDQDLRLQRAALPAAQANLAAAIVGAAEATLPSSSP